jgi:hypothetical protein
MQECVLALQKQDILYGRTLFHWLVCLFLISAGCLLNTCFTLLYLDYGMVLWNCMCSFGWRVWEETLLGSY